MSLPNIFGGKNLKSFIFSFFRAPKQQQQQHQQQEQAQYQEQEQQYQEHETGNYEQSYHPPPTQHQLSSTTHQPPSFEDSLPTAFIPHFPSLSRPNGLPTRSVSSPAPSLLNYTQNRTQRRRTLYIGPGHSSMNRSTRLGITRRQRSGLSRAPTALGSTHDDQVLPESPKRAHHQSIQPLESPEQTPKRTKFNDHQQSSTPIQNHPQPEPSPNRMPSLLPHKAENPNLRAIKNLNVTPMRPSPLRNVTLPSVASSPSSIHYPSPGSVSQTTPSSFPKKRSHQQAASIMSSVMKEVNLEISSRSPPPSPINPSKVINPYSQFLHRPVKHKAPTSSVPTKIPALVHSIQDGENRKRKVQVCLEGNYPTDSTEDQTNHTNSNSNPIEQILKKTMPKEYRPENATANGIAQKKKTRQVGKLPERLLKKQKLREQENKTSSANNVQNISNSKDTFTSQNNDNNAGDQSNASNQSPSSSSINKHPTFSSDAPATLLSDKSIGNSSGKALPNAIEKSSQLKNIPKPSALSTSAKTLPNKIPSSSLFGAAASSNSKSASSRSSLLTAQYPPVMSDLKDHHAHNFSPKSLSVPDLTTSKTSVFSKKVSFGSSDSIVMSQTSPPSVSENIKANPPLFHPFVSDSQHKDQVIEAEHAAGGREVGVQAKDAEEEERIRRAVEALPADEIKTSFDWDLSDPPQPPAKADEGDEHQSIKQTVLGFGQSELPAFVFV